MYTGAPPTTTLVIAKDSTVKEAADLNNTTIAINGLRDLTQFTLLKYLKLQPEIAKTMTRAAYDTSGTMTKSFPAAELIAQP
jgi:hypothetical protein